MDRATEDHYMSLLQELKFVLDTRDFELIYDSRILVNFMGIWKIIAYCNSDFSGDKDNRISVTGFCIYIGTCLIL